MDFSPASWPAVVPESRDNKAGPGGVTATICAVEGPFSGCGTGGGLTFVLGWPTGVANDAEKGGVTDFVMDDPDFRAVAGLPSVST